MTGSVCAQRVNRVISGFLALLLIITPAIDSFAAQSAPRPPLNLVIVEGDGAINNVRQRVAREVIVQVNDENNRPIGGAAVVFLLPRSGAGGSFAGGANSLSVVSNSAGQAAASFTPNSAAGAFQINVTASFEGQTASMTITQTNSSDAKGSSTTTIALIAAAAAAAIAVGLVVRKKDAQSPQTPSIRIGAGVPVFGAPGGFAQSSPEPTPPPKWRP